MFAVHAVYQPRADMRFDRDYYLAHHVPLAEKTFAGKVPAKGFRVYWDTGSLFDAEAAAAPCTLEILFETMADVNRFRDFVAGPESRALHDDIPKYTNCAVAWTVSEIAG